MATGNNRTRIAEEKAILVLFMFYKRNLFKTDKADCRKSPQ